MPYFFSKENTYLICGVNLRAQMIQNNLEQAGYDKCQIIHSELEGYSGAYDNTILIIAFQNALKHDEVARQLFSKGYFNIVFLPTDSYSNDSCANRMREIYNILLYGAIPEFMEIPNYCDVVGSKLCIDNGVIKRNADRITFFARLESLFVNDVCTKKNPIDKAYYGESIVLTEHYRSLFEMLEGKETNQEYLNEYLEAQNYLDERGFICNHKLMDRYNLFKMFKREINKGIDFFAASASCVEGNAYGGFHIKEGLHRAIFLMTQNLSYIPVTVAVSEFNALYSQEVLERISDFFLANQIEKTATPISHPAFMSYPAEKENCEPSVLTAVKRYFGLGGFAGKRILEISDYNSYFARNVGRMACVQPIVAIESQETNKIFFQLACLYNELLNIHNVVITYAEKGFVDKDVDIMFLMGKYQFEPSKSLLLEQISRHVKEAIVFETDEGDLKEQAQIIMVQGKFQSYNRIYRFFNGSSMREVLVFVK